MVGCAIDFCSFLFLFFLVEYSLMPGREGNDISALCFCLHLCLSETAGLVHRTKKSCFTVITENILSLS